MPGIVHVGLPPGYVLHTRGFRQHQLEVPVGQDVPNRLPVNAGRFHRDMRALFLGEHSDSATRLAVVVAKVRTSL